MKKKSILAVLLSIVISVCMMPSVAFANDSQKTEVEIDGYNVSIDDYYLENAIEQEFWFPDSLWLEIESYMFNITLNGEIVDDDYDEIVSGIVDQLSYQWSDGETTNESWVEIPTTNVSDGDVFECEVSYNDTSLGKIKFVAKDGFVYINDKRFAFTEEPTYAEVKNGEQTVSFDAAKCIDDGYLCAQRCVDEKWSDYYRSIVKKHLTYLWKNSSDQVVGSGAQIKVPAEAGTYYNCEYFYDGVSIGFQQFVIEQGYEYEFSINNANREDAENYWIMGDKENGTADIEVLCNGQTNDELYYEWWGYNEEGDDLELDEESFKLEGAEVGDYYCCDIYADETTDEWLGYIYCYVEEYQGAYIKEAGNLFYTVNMEFGQKTTDITVVGDDCMTGHTYKFYRGIEDEPELLYEGGNVWTNVSAGEYICEIYNGEECVNSINFYVYEIDQMKLDTPEEFAWPDEDGDYFFGHQYQFVAPDGEEYIIKVNTNKGRVDVYAIDKEDEYGEDTLIETYDLEAGAFVLNPNGSKKYYINVFLEDEDSEGEITGTIVISKCAHANLELVDKKGASATTNGYTGDLVCKKCGKIVANGQVVPHFTVSPVTYTLPLKIKQKVTAKANLNLYPGDYVTYVASSNHKVATVSGQTIKGKKKGTTTITVRTAYGLKTSFKVKVQKGKVKAKIAISVPTKVKLKKGKTLAIGATKSPCTCKDKLKYSSSKKKVASVSKSGVIKAKKKGKATITVKCGSKKKKIKVTVY